jgi:hypothetical protein
LLPRKGQLARESTLAPCYADGRLTSSIIEAST